MIAIRRRRTRKNLGRYSRQRGPNRSGTSRLTQRLTANGSVNGAKTIRYAVVGLGYIAQAAVLPAFKHARSNSELTALVSDDPKKLKSLGKKYGVKHLYSYDEYDDLLHSGEIDAVFIALPNHMHEAFTVRAANARIHVLCEKPMAVTEQECLRMLDAAQRNRIKLMIAYRLHFEPANIDAIELASKGKLGDLRFFNSVFSMNIKDADNIRVKEETGGGTVYDIGIYCINAARYLFRDEPIEVFAYSVPPGTRDDERFDEVDEMTAASLRFPNERYATFITCFGSADTARYSLVGTKGELELEHAYEYVMPMEMRTKINGKEKTKKYPKHDQFAPELIHFSDCILNDQQPGPSGQEGLNDVRIIEALYRSAKTGQPVRLNLDAPETRPGQQQKMKKRPVREPKLVHAESPSTD